MHIIKSLETNKMEEWQEKKLKGTCLLAEFESRNVKDASDNESWIEVMNE